MGEEECKKAKEKTNKPKKGKKETRRTNDTIERTEDGWRCKTCGKEARQEEAANLRKHATLKHGQKKTARENTRKERQKQKKEQEKRQELMIKARTPKET